MVGVVVIVVVGVVVPDVVCVVVCVVVGVVVPDVVCVVVSVVVFVVVSDVVFVVVFVVVCVVVGVVFAQDLYSNSLSRRCVHAEQDLAEAARAQHTIQHVITNLVTVAILRVRHGHRTARYFVRANE